MIQQFGSSLKAGPGCTGNAHRYEAMKVAARTMWTSWVWSDIPPIQRDESTATLPPVAFQVMRTGLHSCSANGVPSSASDMLLTPDAAAQWCQPIVHNELLGGMNSEELL